MKEELKSEKKKSTGLTLIIVLLILVIVGMAGYIAYDKGYISLGKKETEEKNSNKKTTQKETKTKSEELDVESTEVQDLYYNANNHALLGVDETLYNASELNVSEMTDDYKMQLAYNVFKKNIKESTQGTYIIESVSEENVKSAYEKIFGTDTYKEVESFKVNSCETFRYNKTNKLYEAVTGGCGGTTAFGKVDVVLKATKYEDRIEITSGVVFIDAETSAMYKDYSKKNKIKDLTEDEMTNTLGNTWESKFGTFIKENDTKVGQFTYTFKLADDGSYYYTGVKNTK